MRKSLFFTGFIFLIIISGCSDLTSGQQALNDEPVVIETIARGEILQPGESIPVEYILNETETPPDKLVITVTDQVGNIVFEETFEEDPLPEWIPEIETEQGFTDGLYSLRMDFYTGDELFFSETREFFITAAVRSIVSITSYPPVLYPGGGGLFYADIDGSEEDCWLRWMLDGEKIAEGTVTDGYRSIEIEAPDTEGVYNLSLEVFPFEPPEGGYAFKSILKKEIPLYINKQQKAGVNEFGPANEFSSLFHFRGSYLDSAGADLDKTDELSPVGNPELSVKDGLFGYYMTRQTGFKTESLMIPAGNGELQSFSVMMSMIPYDLPGDSFSDNPDEIFYTGFSDGSLEVSAGVFPDGRMKGEIAVGGERFSLYSEAPLLSEDVYSSVSFAVKPDEEKLVLAWYLDGVPESEMSYYPEPGVKASWTDLKLSEKPAESRILGGNGTSGLMDEFGVYRGAIDPEQFRRAMEYEYGKFLMYAEGFDGRTDDLGFSDQNVFTENSRLVIGPGSSVDFPPIFPGYEEVVFMIETSGAGSQHADAVFYIDRETSGIINARLDDEIKKSDGISFSLIFTTDAVSLDGLDNQSIGTGLTGDFSGIGFRIVNNDQQQMLELESILIIRKNINVTENKVNIPAGKTIRS